MTTSSLELMNKNEHKRMKEAATGEMQQREIPNEHTERKRLDKRERENQKDIHCDNANIKIANNYLHSPHSALCAIILLEIATQPASIRSLTDYFISTRVAQLEIH